MVAVLKQDDRSCLFEGQACTFFGMGRLSDAVGRCVSCSYVLYRYWFCKINSSKAVISVRTQSDGLGNVHTCASATNCDNRTRVQLPQRPVAVMLSMLRNSKHVLQAGNNACSRSSIECQLYPHICNLVQTQPFRTLIEGQVAKTQQAFEKQPL